MSAGVRDAANLCWKLAAVIRGQAPDSLLDTYQVERKPHVVEVTRRAVRTGRLITERRKWLAWLRNHLLRNLTRLPGVLEIAEKLIWIPDARYPVGFFAADAHAAVGWQLPQPWVTNSDGEKVRLDDVIGGRWAVIHLGEVPPGAELWEKLGALTLSVSDLGDDDGALTRWLRAKKAAAVVLRPDGFVYAAASAGGPLPAPPFATPVHAGVTA